MPIYEYQCEETKQTKEVMLPLTLAGLRWMICPIHFNFLIDTCQLEDNHGLEVDKYHKAEKLWSIPAQYSIGKPTRVFVNNRTGDVFTPAKEHEKAPRGFHEIQLKNPTERSKFEKEQQQKIDVKDQMITHNMASLQTESRKNRHDNLKARMNAVQREIDPVTGEKVEFTLEARDKALLEKAMSKNIKKRFREKKSEVKLAVNHNNANNLDEVK